MVGIKELKNKLTYYLRLINGGDRVIVTDRGSPIAVLHSLDHVEEHADEEERLASMAKRGMVRLPTKQKRLTAFKSIEARGKPVSRIIIEERR
jgi:prevent-host-death family protein